MASSQSLEGAPALCLIGTPQEHFQVWRQTVQEGELGCKRECPCRQASLMFREMTVAGTYLDVGPEQEPESEIKK